MTAPQGTSSGARILKLWHQTRALPLGSQLFGLALGRLVPYSGSIAPRVIALEPGYACIAIEDRHRLRNHLSSLHAIALANLGELTGGLAMSTTLPAGVRAIVTGINIDYAKKARGLITAESRVTLPDVTAEIEHAVHAELRDASNDVVARLTARWRLRPA